MPELRNVVRRERIDDLAPEINRRNEDQRERDLAFFHVGERAQNYHHEHDTAGSDYASGEEYAVYESRGDTGHEYHKYKVSAAVFFLNDRPDKEHQQHIAGVVLPAGMPEEVGQAPHIRHRVKE